MKYTAALALTLSLAGTASALAGPASDLATQHIAAIAAVEEAKITAPYDAASTLHWA